MKVVIATVTAGALLAVGVWVYMSAARRDATLEDDDRGRAHGVDQTRAFAVRPPDRRPLAVSADPAGPSHGGQERDADGIGVDVCSSSSPEEPSRASEGIEASPRARSRAPERGGAPTTAVEDDLLLSRVQHVAALRYPGKNPVVALSRAVQAIGTGLLDGAVEDPRLPVLVEEVLEELERSGSLV